MNTSIIQKDGKYYQEVELEMLATKEKFNYNQFEKSMFIANGHDTLYFGRPSINGITIQHLYITSNEIIKEGDIRIQVGAGIVFTTSKNEAMLCKGSNSWKKVISTTDSLLIKEKGWREENDILLPQLSSKEFIPYFIEKYNKGNKIQKVLVEMEISQKIGESTFIGGKEQIVEDIWLSKTNNEWYFDTNKKLDFWSCTYKLKVNEDNTINIITHPEKPIYTETELHELIEKYDREFKIDTFAYTRPCSFTVKEWINKNIKKIIQ